MLELLGVRVEGCQVSEHRTRQSREQEACRTHIELERACCARWHR